MSNNYTRQYEAPIKPQNWTGDTLRFYRMLIDVLDDIYLKYGRIDEKMLGTALAKKINSKADNGTVAEIKLEQGVLSASFTALSGDVTELTVDVEGLNARIAGAEGGITTLEATAQGLVTRVQNAEGDISALEQTATELSATVTSKTNNLQSQINQTPGLISAAVGDIAIGGRNLLINSSLYRSGSPVTATSSSTDYFAPNREMYMPCTPGETYTFQAVTDGIWGNHASNGSSPPVTHLFLYLQTAEIPFENSGSFSKAVSLNAGTAYAGKTGRGTWTYTIPTDQAYVRLRIRYDIHSDGSTPATVNWWDFKAERGNKATDWTPPEGEDYAKGVVNGSGLRITQEELTLYAAKSLDINVQGENGDAHFGSDGLAVDQINSGSVYSQYNGPVVLTVGNYSVSPNGESTFATLHDAFEKLSNKHLPGAVTINFASDTFETHTKLYNVTGAPIVINGNNCRLTGQVTIENVVAEVTFNHLTVQFGGAGHVFVARHCRDVGFANSTINAGYPTHAGQNGVYGITANIGFDSCAFTNCYHAIWLADNSRAYINACTGSNNLYSIILRTHSSAGVITSRPPGTIHVDASCTRPTITDIEEGETVTPPENVQTVILAATNTRTHDGGGWYSGTSVLSQGVRNGTTFMGFMWFDLSAIAGKTIQSAAIRLYRRAGVGSGNSVKVLVGTHKASGPSGALNLINGYDDYVVGMVGQKELLKAAVSTEAVQQLASGSAKGLYIHSDSNGYAQFDGIGDANPPQLYVTYI